MKKESDLYEALRGVGSKATFGSPIIAALLSSLLLGQAGKMAGPWAVRRFTGMSGPGSDPNFEFSQGQEDKIRNRFKWTGRALGALPWLPLIYSNLKGASMKKSAQFIPYHMSRELLIGDPYMSTMQKAQAVSLLDTSARLSPLSSSGSKVRGILTTGDMIRGAVGAGMGFGASRVAGTVMGLTLGLPSQTLRRFSQLGTLAGALAGAGVITKGD